MPTDDPERKWTEGIDPALTFTREDVALLARLSESHDMAANESHGWLDVSLSRDEADRMRSLAARIAALLSA